MAGRRGEEKLDSKIIIRNYPLETTEKDMRIMFEKYGKIDDCKCAKTHLPFLQFISWSLVNEFLSFSLVSIFIW